MKMAPSHVAATVLRSMFWLWSGVFIVTPLTYQACGEEDNRRGRAEQLLANKNYEKFDAYISDAYFSGVGELCRHDLSDIYFIAESILNVSGKSEHDYQSFYWIALRMESTRSDDPGVRVRYINTQARLVALLLADMSKYNDQPTVVREQARDVCVRFVDNLNSMIITNYQPIAIMGAVPPPYFTDAPDCVSLNPVMVRNREYREKWLTAIKNNNMNDMANKEQATLARLRNEYEPQISSFLERLRVGKENCNDY